MWAVHYIVSQSYIFYTYKYRLQLILEIIYIIYDLIFYKELWVLIGVSVVQRTVITRLKQIFKLLWMCDVRTSI